MYDLHRLRLLRELRNRGSLAAVAEALGYNPSSVSHQLTLLKREVGTELFEPHGRGVRLTVAGQLLANSAEAIMTELESAQAQVAALTHEVAGTIKVAAFQTASHALLPQAITELKKSYPLLNITFRQLQAEQALPALLAQDFDLVICEEYPGNPLEHHPGIRMQIHSVDSLRLALPSKYTMKTLSQCNQLDWVMEPLGTRARMWAMAQCREAGFEPHVIYETSDVYAHHQFVETGLAAAFLPQLIVSDKAKYIDTGSSRKILLGTRNGAQVNPALTAVTKCVLAIKG